MASAVWRPRSLATRQLLAATLGLLAFLALVGYALDRAFVDTAESNLRQRLESYAMAYAGDTDFDRAGDIVPPYISPDPRFDRPGSGLYAAIVLPNGRWDSMSTQGPRLPPTGMLAPAQQDFVGPLPITQLGGTQGEVYRFGVGLICAV